MRDGQRDGWMMPMAPTSCGAAKTSDPTRVSQSAPGSLQEHGQWEGEYQEQDVGKRDREVMEERKRMQKEKEKGKTGSRVRILTGIQN